MAIIKGKWIWNNTSALIQPEGTEQYYEENVIFTSNGETFSGLRISTELGTDYIYYGSDAIYEYGGWWSYSLGCDSYETYKEMDFGESGVTISDGLYATIAANATPYIPVDYSTKAINLDQLKLVYDNLNNKIPSLTKESIRDTLGDKLELRVGEYDIGYLQITGSYFTIDNGVDIGLTIGSDYARIHNVGYVMTERNFVSNEELAAYLGI